jgi:hypothetical protein
VRRSPPRLELSVIEEEDCSTAVLQYFLQDVQALHEVLSIACRPLFSFIT